MKLAVKLELAFVIGALFLIATGANAQRQMEKLGRGVVAINKGDGQVYVGWRMLGTDTNSIAFNLYRSTGGGMAVKLNTSLITNTTDYLDTGVDTNQSNAYLVRPVMDGVEQAASAAFTLPANAPANPYLSFPLQIPLGGTTPDGTNYIYSANDCSVGDLDGDGEYEIILKWDPSNSKDNSQSGYTGNVYLDAYKLDGTRLWRIDLGRNIRAGAHYTQFIVYDLDGDGRAEVACKTAPGTVDGQGNNVIMPGDDPNADYRNSSGYILSGPEYLTIFNGQTGAALVTTNYIAPRGTVSDWGDSYGNRVDRFLACAAYLDGQRPSLVMCRGYYTGSGGVGKTVLAAWDWRNGQLTQRWIFNANPSTNSAYLGQGNHNLSVGDVDGDGKDEIVYGACAIDHNGTGLYTTGWGHGDAMHLSDMDPDRPGLEVWDVHETPNPTCGGGEFRDAKTGALIFGLPGTRDTGRGLAAHIDPGYRGFQMWSSASDGVYDIHGTRISTNKPSTNFVVWWDADLCRELLDASNAAGTSPKLDKWTGNGVTRVMSIYNYGAASNNGTKANPCLTGDILGDWREEMVFRSSDSTKLMIFSTTVPATNRFYTFMHDPQYRLSIAWQNVAYNQPPHTSFYVGTGMAAPPTPNIYLVGATPLPAAPSGLTATAASTSQINLTWTDNSTNETGFLIERSPDSVTFTQGVSVVSNVTTYSDTGLVGGTTYYYRVRAYNDSVNSEFSNIATATTRNCTYLLSATNGTHNARAGSGTFNVTTGSGCSWSAVSDASWLHTTSSGTGNGTVGYTVDDNLGVARSGAITVQGQTFTVNQACTILATIGNIPVVAPGSALAFTAVTFDPGGDALSYLWSFGDGTTSTETNPPHVFSNCGPHTVTLTMNEAGGPINTNFMVSVACPFSEPVRLTMKSNFAPGKLESATLSARLDLPLGLDVTNRHATLDIGGVAIPFTLNAKGKGVNGSSTLTVSHKGAATSTVWQVSVKFGKGDWDAEWLDDGLANETVKNKPITVPVLLYFDSDPPESFFAERSLLYKATAGKSGSAH